MTQEQETRAKIDEKLSTTTFTWVIGIMVLVLMGVFAWQTSRISAMEDKVTDSQLSGARIEVQLTQIQKDLLDIKLSFQKHIEK